MIGFERLARFSDRVFDRLRDKRAFSLTDAKAIDGDFDSLRGCRYAVIVTFRRDGDAVPSPVWFAVDGTGRAYVKTRVDSGKVKRLRNDSRTLIVRSNARGRPTGPAIRGTGRILPNEEWAHSEAALTAAYGTGRKLSERVLAGPDQTGAYIEITPRR